MPTTRNVDDAASGSSAGDTSATQVAFSPAVPANWSGGVDPGNVKQALDQLAAGTAGAHTLLDGTFHTDTLVNTPTAGSLIMASGAGLWDELNIGDTYEYLMVGPTGKAGWVELSIAHDTSPQLGGPLDYNGQAIVDANGNPVLEFGSVASAVTGLKITNAVTADSDGVLIEAVSDDDNANLSISCKNAPLASNSHVEMRCGSAGRFRIATDGTSAVVASLTLNGVAGRIISLSADETSIAGTLNVEGNVYANDFIADSGSVVVATVDAASAIQLAPEGNLTFAAKTVASAVNSIETTSAATTAAPSIMAVGSDANVGLTIGGKGTGVIGLASDALFATDMEAQFRDSGQRIYSSAEDVLDLDTGADGTINVRVGGTGYHAFTKSDFRSQLIRAKGNIDAGAGGYLTIGNEIVVATGTNSAMYHKAPTGFSNQNDWLIVDSGGTQYAIFMWRAT